MTYNLKNDLSQAHQDILALNSKNDSLVQKIGNLDELIEANQ